MSNKIKLVGLVIPLGVIVSIVIAVYAMFQRRQREETQNLLEIVESTSMNDDLEIGTGTKRFSFLDLAFVYKQFLR